MKGLTLSILVILFSLMLGASSGVALGSFVIPNDVPAPTQSNAAIQNQSNNHSGSVGIAVDTVTSQESVLDSPRFSSPNGKPVTAQQQNPSSSNGTATSTQVLRLLSVVQVSNQVPSSLLVGTCGDSNADGVFDIGDAVTSLQLAVGLEQPTRFHEVFGDLNGDGFLNILDTIKALQHLISQDPIPNDCGPFADQ